MSKTTRKPAHTEEAPVSTHFSFNAVRHAALGKEIKLSPRTHVSINQPGAFINFPTPNAVMAHFGIGKDHVGYLVMTESAWEALNRGEKIDTTTIARFRSEVLGASRPPAPKRKGGRK